MLGRLPTPAEYLTYANDLQAKSDQVYRYLNFDKIPAFVEQAAVAKNRALPVLQ
jgi:aconitate hydratase 2/2-methylisocitrate dehydratase